jgi:hypothetical protein
MRLAVFLAALVALIAVSACQTERSDEPNGMTYSKSDTNKARTDDPIKALQKY